MSKPAAFFDLDWTILSVNSGALWMKRERRLNRLTRWQYTQALLYLVAYRLNLLDIEAATRKALTTIKGEREETIEQWTAEWYHTEIASQVSPGAWRTLDEHRRQGHPVVLLTSCSKYEAQLACAHLRMDAWLASHYEVVDGVFTGEPLMPICYGDGKVIAAERWAHQNEVDLSHSYFYSDSASDLPMLKRVGKPRLVNPDLHLRWHARRFEWPVLDWTR